MTQYSSEWSTESKISVPLASDLGMTGARPLGKEGWKWPDGLFPVAVKMVLGFRKGSIS